MVNFRLGDFALFFFAGIRDWSEIYRYVMILAHFEVGINMPMCYLTMKMEAFLSLSVLFK